MSKLKIAIAYSGRPRDIISTFPNHVKYLGIGQPNVSVFGFLWFDELLAGTCFRRDHPYQGLWPDNTIKEWISENWRPQSMRYCTPKDFSYSGLNWNNRWPRFHPKDNVLSEIYAHSEVLRIVNEYESATSSHFDLVVRLRTDALLNESFADLSDLNPNYVHLAPGPISQRELANGLGGLGDFSALLLATNSNSSYSLSKFYDSIDRISSLGFPMYFPEALWSYYIREICKLEVMFHPWQIKLYCGSNETYKPNA